MGNAGKVLAVEVVQLAAKVAQSQGFAHCVIGTGIAEIRRCIAAVAIGEQASAVGRIALLESLQMATGQGQPVNIAGDQLGALVGLRQQARVVVHQYRGLGQQRTVLDHGLAQPGFGGDPGTGKLIGRAAIVMHRQQAGTAAPAARVQPDAHQRHGIQAYP
ncbi:hypothetical protein D3C80_1456760 [compost metagenome]